MSPQFGNSNTAFLSGSNPHVSTNSLAVSASMSPDRMRPVLAQALAHFHSSSERSCLCRPVWPCAQQVPSHGTPHPLLSVALLQSSTILTVINRELTQSEDCIFSPFFSGSAQDLVNSKCSVNISWMDAHHFTCPCLHVLPLHWEPPICSHSFHTPTETWLRHLFLYWAFLILASKALLTMPVPPTIRHSQH